MQNFLFFIEISHSKLFYNNVLDPIPSPLPSLPSTLYSERYITAKYVYCKIYTQPVCDTARCDVNASYMHSEICVLQLCKICTLLDMGTATYVLCKLYALQDIYFASYMLCKIYTLQAICSARYAHCKVYAIQGICYTRYMLYKVYALQDMFTASLKHGMISAEIMGY